MKECNCCGTALGYLARHPLCGLCLEHEKPEFLTAAEFCYRGEEDQLRISCARLVSGKTGETPVAILWGEWGYDFEEVLDVIEGYLHKVPDGMRDAEKLYTEVVETCKKEE